MDKPKINGKDLPAGYRIVNGQLREIGRSPELVIDAPVAGGRRVDPSVIGSINPGTAPAIPTEVHSQYGLVADALGTQPGLLRDADQIQAVVQAVLGQNPDITSRQLLDAAPNLYAFGDLVYRIPNVLREVLTAPYARTVFPVLSLATWMQTWEQPALRERSGYAHVGNLERTSRLKSLQSESMGRRVGFLEWLKSAADWDWLELAKAAEARDRGATVGYDFVGSRLMSARKEILRMENLIVLFGLQGTQIDGLLSTKHVDGSATSMLTDASGQTFDNATPEQARDMLLTGVKAILENGEREAMADSIAMGTNAWLAVNTQIYEDAASNTGRTVLEMALESLNRLGISRINWLPELDYKAGRVAQLQQHGFSAAEAQAYAGGLNQENVLLTYNSSIEAGRIIEGRAIAARPPEERSGKTAVMMYSSTGGFDLPMPKTYHLLTDV